MKLPGFILLRAEDFPALVAASQGGAEKLFRMLNQALSGLVSAVNGGLTLGDNLRGFTSTVTFRVDDLPVRLKNTLSVAPVSVQIARALDLTLKSPTPITTGNPAWSFDSKEGVLLVSKLGGDADGKPSNTQLQVTFQVTG